MPVNGHSRKGSLLVGEGIDIKKGPIAFGSVDSPNAFLSSSPATPSLIGGHLANSVQSFGSLPADSSTSGNDLVKDSRRPTNMTTTTTNPGGKKPFDVHQFFTKPAAQQSQPQQQQQQQPQQQQQQQQQPGSPAVSPNPITSPPPTVNGHGMPLSQYRPPVQQQMMPQQGGPMRPQNGPYPPRPMMMGQQQPGMPPYGQHGGPQNPYMMQQYPAYGYQQYPGGFEQHYAPQWQQAQQHRQGQPPFGISPRGNTPGLPVQSQPSPAHPSASLPGNGSLSPAPTPPSRPHSHLQHPVPSSAASIPSMPGTPGARPPSQPPTANFVPQQQGPPSAFGLSGGASTFTPRKSAAIAIRRPDGTVLDTKSTSASSSAATPGNASNGTNTPEESAAPKTEQPSALKKKGPFPVMVRIESEDAKKARLAEEATAEKCRKEDEAYEAEKKERKARQAREAEEKRVAEEAKAKEDAERAAADAKAAEEQKKQDEAKKAEEDASKKREADAAKAAKEAEDKKAEEDKAARAKAEESDPAQPKAGSASGSTHSSPQSAAAGLPPKPSSSTGSAAPAAAAAGPSAPRRSVPAPLDLQPTTPRTPVQDAQPSALATAKPITDLKAVNYQSPIQSPDSNLQKGAEPGKFRYDRDFLMQFMSVCKEKPASLPPLEEIGLEADTSSGFGKRGTRGSVGGTPRSSTGLGIAGAGGSQQRFPSQGMGSFGTGSFGSGQIGSIRGTTSEDRYQRSMANAGRGGAAGGGRAPSQQGMLPPMNTSGPRLGGRASNRGTRRPPQASFQTHDNTPVQALQTSENAWVTAGRKLGEDDKRSPTYISRKVKSLLNKLTAEKFDSISDQVLEYVNYSVDEEHPVSMQLVIQLIFEKATDEALWGAMYAKLCKKMMLEVDQAVTETIDGKPTSGGMLFRKYLVGRCQLDFEAGWKEREAAIAKAAEKGEDDKARMTEQAEGKSSEPAVLSDEYYALQKIKRRGLGLIQLIGELFKLEMVNKNVMKGCFVKLLGHVHETDEEDVESACKLLKTIGPIYDQQSGDNVSGIIRRLEEIHKDPATSNRIKFMIQDIIDLRDAGWKGKAAAVQTSTMTIAEVHQQAAREQAQQKSSTQQSISRNGSRAGQPRGGNDWQPAPTQPRPSRPADMSNLGRINSTNAAPTFSGPQSAFGRNRRGGGAGNQSTPPISRQASQANLPNMSNANQFALLNDANETAESTEAGGAAPQRRRLQLAPRTVPVDGEGGDAAPAGEGEGEEGAEGSDDQDAESSTESDEVKTPKPMTETAARAKIDLDMKELWGEKDSGGSRDPDDIVHYFKALPEHHRPLLAVKLYDEVFRTAKLKDAEIVAKGLASAVEEGAASPEILKKGLGGRMVSLDDDSIDFPQAYKAVAVIMRRLSLSQEDIDELTGKIDVYGEPKITPKMKLERALTAVDDEAAAAASA